MGSRPALVLELLNEGSLEDKLECALPPAVAIEVGRQISTALAMAHSAGSVHGDLKPANVLVGEHLRLADFGMGNNPACTVMFTLRGGGTPGFIAPEVVWGSPCSFESDVFSLGATLFQVFTGVSPATVARGQLCPGQLDASRWRPDLPTELVRLIAAATSPFPAARPSAAWVAAALAKIGRNMAVFEHWRTRAPELQVLRVKPNPLGRSLGWPHPMVQRGEFIDVVCRTPWHPIHRVSAHHLVPTSAGGFDLETIGMPFWPAQLLPAGSTVRLFMGPPPAPGELFSLDPADQTGFDRSVFLGCGHSLRDWGPDAVVLTLNGSVLDWSYYGDRPQPGDLQIRRALARYLPAPNARPVGLPTPRLTSGAIRPQLPWGS